ncbi:ribose import ATP-binding protein RbsA 2 [Spirochaetia bacterium]|nr:ribose import ATP-binding protein RbsA 2 [Spirochaetia bacterium]
MNTVLEVTGITKSFVSNKVLDGVNFSLERGEVHALAGENGAGKSTLMNIVSGVLTKDSGKIVFDGQEVSFPSPREAMKTGIGFLHQELALCQHLSVAENIYLWGMPKTKLGLIKSKDLYRNAAELLSQFHVEFPVTKQVSRLSVAQQQVVEVAKALSMNAKVLIFDEPTSSLTGRETEYMFQTIERLKSQGIGIVYISHRMSEIFRLCDRVTVLRDGKTISTYNTKDVTPSEVVTKMVGRTISAFYPPKAEIKSDEELLRVEGLSSKRFKNVSFTLHKGEILGFSGLVGAGRSEVARAICGLDRCESGEVWFNGEKIVNKKYRDAIANGICYLTEDRKKNGLFLKMDIIKNISVAVINDLSRYLMIENSKERVLANEQITSMKVKTSNAEVKVRRLSGGNQQKVMIGKWLVAKPAILIMDEPTRGIDVGAKSEIHHMLRNLCEQGIGVIIISSEMPEIIGMSDRVVVMHEGSITGIVSGEEINETSLIMLASNQVREGDN